MTGWTLLRGGLTKLVTPGFLFGGRLHQIVGTDVLVGVLTQSSLTGNGFAVLAYSLYAEELDGTDVPAGARRTER